MNPTASAAAAALVLGAALPSQSLIVDGDLEGHTAGPGCVYNNSIALFNGYYASIHSFGIRSGIDIMGGPCYGIPPLSGSTKLALAWNNVANGNKDAMALDLTAALTPGNVYYLSFCAEDLPFGPGSQPFEIGVSTVNNAFGTLIYSGVATQLSWTNYTVTFPAPVAATCLTVRCPPGLDMWVAFDAFRLHHGTVAVNTTFGSGCGSTSPPPCLTASTRPIIGTSWDFGLSISDPNAVVGFLMFGFTNPGLPVGQAPGCTHYTSGLISLFVGLPVPTPAVSAPLPLDWGLVGISVFAQGGAFVPNANPIWLTASNGLQGLIGDL